MKEKCILGISFFLALLLLPLLALSVPRQPSLSSSESSSRDEPASSQESSAPAGEGTEDVFRILDTSTDTVLEVNRMDFLRGAAAAEMPLSFETQALCAQMVASYTYYGRLRENARKNPDPALKGADFSANIQNWEKYTTKEQMEERWGDQFSEYFEKLTQAAEEVQGLALTYEGEWIDATYYAISAGTTENAKDIWGGDLPYLTAVASPGDALAPGYRTTEVFSSQELQEALSASFSDLSFSQSPEEWLGDMTRSASGSVLSAEVCGQTLPGEQLRWALGLRSQNFTVRFQEDSFTFTVLGYGHGVGMSQTGAQQMAKQGASFREILSWYYPGTRLSPV